MAEGSRQSGIVQSTAASADSIQKFLSWCFCRFSKVQIKKEASKKLYNQLCEWKHHLTKWKVKTSKSWLGPHQTASEDWGRLPVERCNHHSGSRWTILCCLIVFLRGSSVWDQKSKICHWTWFFYEGTVCGFQWKPYGISAFLSESTAETGKSTAETEPLWTEE